MIKNIGRREREKRDALFLLTSQVSATTTTMLRSIFWFFGIAGPRCAHDPPARMTFSCSELRRIPRRGKVKPQLSAANRDLGYDGGGGGGGGGAEGGDNDSPDIRAAESKAQFPWPWQR